MKKRPTKRSRENIVKAIGREATMQSKLERARGKRLTVSGLADELDCATIVDRARWMVSAKLRDDAIIYHAARIGAAVVSAIVRGDYTLIQKLAAQVQFGGRKQSRLHELIGTFCHCHDCGTKDNPAPAQELVAYLRDLGIKFSISYENEIPRSLVKTCEKIGVWIANR